MWGPVRVNRWQAFRDRDMLKAFTRDLSTSPYLFFLVFFVCLRGAQPCTINPVSDRQTLVCLLFCCWLPTDVHVCCCCTCCLLSLMPRKSSLRQMFEVVFCYVVLVDVKIDLKNHSFSHREGHFGFSSIWGGPNHEMCYTSHQDWTVTLSS